MATLAARISDLATRIATEIKPIKTVQDSEFLFTGGGEVTIQRTDATISGVPGMASGFLHLQYFTAKRTESINIVRTFAGIATSGTAPTLCRIGIYQEDSSTGNLTLISSTPNDTTLWSSNLAYTSKALSTTFSKIKGNRYAMGDLVVTTGSNPTLIGLPNAGFFAINSLFKEPKLTAQLGGQTDLPATVLNTALGGSTRANYHELLP